MLAKGNVFILLLVIIGSVIVSVFLLIENMTKTPDFSSLQSQYSSDHGKVPGPDELKYLYSAELLDTNNLGIRGTTNTTFFGGSFTIYTKIFNLKDPGDGKQYIGWLVRRDPNGSLMYFKVGTAYKNIDDYVNIFQGGTDITHYRQYILSVESDENVSIPSNKIAEAFLVKNENNQSKTN